MNTSLLKVDLRHLPKIFLLLSLISYPLFCYLGIEIFDKNQELFVLICLSYLLFRVFEIYKTRVNLSMPFYVLLFGLFTAYTLLSGIFMSDYFAERGIKYFYTDSIWLTFIALIIVENTYYSDDLLKFAKKILGLTLILAAIVSIIQIFKPLFFVNDAVFVQGLSYDRMAAYYDNMPNKEIGTAHGEAGKVSRFFQGYRPSIFSYVNVLSVGIDTIAIFSILMAWKPVNLLFRGVFVVSTAIISILSSARWIILGFIVVASHIIWVGKNKLNNFIYFLFSGIILFTFLILIANFIGFDVEKYTSERLMDDSASTRLLAFEVFYEVFPDNPIFGTGGVDTEKMLRLIDGKSSQIHVGFLKLFYYYGLIGGSLYVSFMVALLVRLRKMAKHSGYWGGFLAILTFFIANLTLVELSLFYYGLLLAIIFANHYYFNNMANKKTLIFNGKIYNPVSNEIL